MRACGSGLEREGRRHGVQYVNAALFAAGTTGCALHGASLAFAPRSHSTGPSGGSIGFALLGDSLFPNAEKVSKNACPCIRVSLRSTSLTPSALRGPANKGHPWPFTPLAASMPLAPLRTDSVRPPERGIWWGLIASSSTNKQRVLVPLFANFQAARTRLPFRRSSVGAAQGDARHGRRARSEGTGTSLRDGPRSSAGGREFCVANRGRLARMSGWPSFWLLFLGPGGAPQARKSDAPCEAQPVVRAEESAARPNRPPKPTTVTSATSLTSDATSRRTNQASGTPRRPHTMSLSPCA
ncbi:hypothetical protein AB691_0839 [Stutzerimonas stutzeri]|nr:hypothetical protein AB691_0839 [Stutzerimonas stutzeri]